MLSEKQFRERTKGELRQIGNQVLGLATDRDIYRKMEREVILPNPRLAEARSPFLDMLRGCYADAMTARLLRLLDGEDGGISLPRALTQLADYPQLLEDRLTQSEFANDRGALERAAAGLKHVSATHLDHHERTLSALASTHRALDDALDLMIETVKTYYWIVAESYIDLEVKHSEDSLAIISKLLAEL
jgi:hypothetical protein